MTTKTKKLAALLMSGIMTLSIAPVVHADDKVELTGMVQQSRWYSGLQSMVEKLEEEENISIEFEVVPDDQYDNLMKMRLNSHEAPDLIAYQFADLFAAVDPEEFFVSLDDELMQRFAGEKLQSFSNYLDDDMAIENKMVSKAIENAQKRVEGQNFDSRKHILEYDDVMRQQREVMYKERDEIMSLDNLDDIIKGMFNQAIEMTINRCTTHGKHDEVDVDAVLDFVAKNYMLLAEIDAKNKDVVKNDSKKLLETLTEICFSQYQMRLNKDIDHAKIVNYERSVLLGVIDYTWINHIDAMTKLRNGIYLRAYAQKNPLSEYTEEAFYMFEQMKLSIVDMISKNIVHMGIRPGSSAEENIPHLKLEVEFK